MKIKIFPPTYLNALLIIEIALHFLLPVIQIISAPFRYLGAIVFAFGLALNVYAVRYLKSVNTTSNFLGKADRLATSGPFQKSRNPIYLSGVLLSLGIAVFLGSLTPFTMPILLFLITLRNTCSMSYADYREDGRDNTPTYFPIARTKALIEMIRSVSDRPVTVGGYGFSILAQELMPILQPDFGVFGGADDFFRYFEEILAGNYRHVANLLYFEGDNVVANKRTYFPPALGTEYTPQAIAGMLAFYEKFPKLPFQGAPVEIMRGCNHACVFCSEPFVTGHQVQYRDLRAIMADIELLAKNGVSEVCMVMSELNPEGNDFILRLADAIRVFNEGQAAEQQVSWFGANYLMTFDEADFRRLYTSGFKGGWFDITALDDDNARAMRTPYRNETLVGRLQHYAKEQRARINQVQTHAEEAGGSSEGEKKVRWSMFLGNPSTTMDTVRRTLAAAHDAGLDNAFDSAQIIRPLRVFDYEQPSLETLAVTFSVNEQLQRVPYQQTLPSFAYPPALLDHLGSEEAIEEMFNYISDTYLSTRYTKTRDWVEFLAKQAPGGIPVNMSSWGERPSPAQEKELIDSFLQKFFGTYAPVLAQIGLPASLADLERATPYSLATTLYARWPSTESVVKSICEQAQIGKKDDRYRLVTFFVKVIMYRLNVVLRAQYKPLFTPPPSSTQVAGS